MDYFTVLTFRCVPITDEYLHNKLYSENVDKITVMLRFLSKRSSCIEQPKSQNLRKIEQRTHFSSKSRHSLNKPYVSQFEKLRPDRENGIFYINFLRPSVKVLYIRFVGFLKN